MDPGRVGSNVKCKASFLRFSMTGFLRGLDMTPMTRQSLAEKGR